MNWTRARDDDASTLRTSRVAGVVFDPRDSQVLYVGTEGGGVFKSRNGGATWTAINQGLTNLTVFALEIGPQDPPILYAGGGSGVFKTVTGGEVATGQSDAGGRNGFPRQLKPFAPRRCRVKRSTCTGMTCDTKALAGYSQTEWTSASSS
jgi:hypothetical protein